MKFKFWKKEKPKEEPKNELKDEAREAIEKMLEPGILTSYKQAGDFPRRRRRGRPGTPGGRRVRRLRPDRPRPGITAAPGSFARPLNINWKGHCYGVDGASLVKSIGLEFPNAATPWASDVDIEGGVLVWGRRTRPEAQEIAQVVQETQRQVARIMRRYGETKEILAALKKGGDSQ